MTTSSRDDAVVTRRADRLRSRFGPSQLAAYATRHPRRVLWIWGVVVFISLGLTGALMNTALTADSTLTNNPESVRAKHLIDTRLPAKNKVDEVIVVRSERAVVSSRAFRQRVRALVRDARATGSVSQIRAYYNGGGPTLVSGDGHATMLPLVLKEDKAMRIHDLIPVIERADGQAGFKVKIAGKYTLGHDFNTVSEHDLRNGELKFGLPAALIVLLLVFGTFTGAMIPMLMAIMSILVGLGIVSVVGQVFQLNLFITNMVVAMGLALGIDYSLFIVSRLREERHRGRSTEDAIVAVANTATRAVVFSGSAFALAMIGMLLVPETTLRSLGFGAVVVGLVSIVVALTFHPAVLMLMGDRIDRTRVPWLGKRIAASAGEEGPVWRRMILAVLRRPALSLVATAVLLLALAYPVLGLKVGSSGSSSLPNSTLAKQGLRALQRDFARGATDPVNIVVEAPPTSPQTKARLERLRRELGTDPVYETTAMTYQTGRGIVVASVPLTVEPTSTLATAAVGRARNEYVPTAFGAAAKHVYVGGGPAEARDTFAVDRDWLPIVIAFVLGLTLVLLTVAFRSIVIPLTSIAVNLLSVGAAYGILVLFFQHGVGADLLGFGRAPRIDSWVPIFLFAVLFGLSMDYQVFLLSRIRERWGTTGDTSGAIVHGVASTARLITGAAAIIIVVYLGFASGQLVSFQEMGFGIAVALAIDATLVRLLLIPSAMRLLGTRNWYLPAWLEWLPHLSIEGEALAEAPGADARAPRPEMPRRPVAATNGGGHYDVVVIGAGQAGLAISYHLARQDYRFLILERDHDVAPAWRERWDSLTLFTPRRYDSLPGLEFPGDPDGYPTADEVLAYLQGYAAHFDLPVRLSTPARRLSHDGARFVVDLDDGRIAADQVVIATGAFQEPRVPAFAGDLTGEVVQMHSSRYRRPTDLPAGRLLVVGGGNTGYQIAQELAAGRETHLAIGTPQKPLPQRLLGRDLFWWLTKTGVINKSIETKVGRRLSQSETLVGPLPKLAKRCGVISHGRATAADGRTVAFEDGSSLEVDGVVWATGFHSDYSWVDLPLTDDAGRIRHRRGVTEIRGLYTIGLQWQWSRGSALLGFVNNDASYLAERIDQFAAAETQTEATMGQPDAESYASPATLAPQGD